MTNDKEPEYGYLDQQGKEVKDAGHVPGAAVAPGAAHPDKHAESGQGSMAANYKGRMQLAESFAPPSEPVDERAEFEKFVRSIESEQQWGVASEQESWAWRGWKARAARSTKPQEGAVATDRVCEFCGVMTSSLSANPGMWPLVFTHPDGSGRVKYHHVRCVQDRLFADPPTQPEALGRAVGLLKRALSACTDGNAAGLAKEIDAFLALHPLDERN